jgi:hypothetical protein
MCHGGGRWWAEDNNTAPAVFHRLFGSFEIIGPLRRRYRFSEQGFGFIGREQSAKYLSEQVTILRPGVLLEQPDMDFGELGTGIFEGVGFIEGALNDLAAGVVIAGGFLGLSLEALDFAFIPSATFSQQLEAFFIGQSRHVTG